MPPLFGAPRNITKSYITGPGGRLGDWARCRRASQAVEFAIVAPLLCFMMLAMVYLGLYVGTAHSVAEMASEVSRYSLVGRDRTERQALAAEWMTRAGPSYVLLKANRLSLKTAEADDLLTVTIAYDVSYLPVPGLVRALVDLGPSITRSAAVHLP